MSDEVVEVTEVAEVSEVAEVADVVEVMPDPTGGKPLDAGPTTRAVSPGEGSEDLMVQYGLSDVLNDLRSRKLRSSFMHYIPELPTDKVPLKPRCPGGQLMEIAMQPVNEDERKLELFDERVIRKALTLKETGEKVKMPEWLEIEQSWGDEDRRKRRRDKKKKKKKKKRKREEEGLDGGRLDEDERRLRKKRK